MTEDRDPFDRLFTVVFSSIAAIAVLVGVGLTALLVAIAWRVAS